MHAGKPPRMVYRFDRFTLDLARGALLGPEGAELPLRPKSFALLRLLVENAGRLLDRDTIMAAVWPDCSSPTNRSPSASRHPPRPRRRGAAAAPDRAQARLPVRRRGLVAWNLSAAPRAARRLAAILAADVVGYSRLMGQDEQGTLERLKAHRKEFVEPLVAEHRGRIVNLAGDGALCEFASIVEAVACAVAIQDGHGRARAGPARGRAHPVPDRGQRRRRDRRGRGDLRRRGQRRRPAGRPGRAGRRLRLRQGVRRGPRQARPRLRGPGRARAQEHRQAGPRLARGRCRGRGDAAGGRPPVRRPGWRSRAALLRRRSERRRHRRPGALPPAASRRRARRRARCRTARRSPSPSTTCRSPTRASSAGRRSWQALRQALDRHRPQRHHPVAAGDQRAGRHRQDPAGARLRLRAPRRLRPDPLAARRGAGRARRRLRRPGAGARPRTPRRPTRRR